MTWARWWQTSGPALMASARVSQRCPAIRRRAKIPAGGKPWKREEQQQMQTLTSLHRSSSEVLPGRYQDGRDKDGDKGERNGREL